MKITVIILAFLILPVYAAEDNWEQWCKEYNKKIDFSIQLPEQERIPILQEVVLIGPTSESRELEGARLEIFKRAQKELIAIPGHAEYFEKRILKVSKEYKNLPEEVYSDPVNRFLDEIIYGFGTLAQLQSPETVKVLGEMLSDEWQATPGPVYGDRVFSSMAAHGALTLHKLPLVDPPSSSKNTKLTGKEQIPDWQLWYAERKSGLKTFAFKGEPKEYRFKPDGTWETIPISIPPEEVVTKAPIAAAPEPIVTPPPTQDRAWIWITSLAVFFLAVVGWLVRKKNPS